MVHHSDPRRHTTTTNDAPQLFAHDKLVRDARRHAEAVARIVIGQLLHSVVVARDRVAAKPRGRGGVGGLSTRSDDEGRYQSKTRITNRAVETINSKHISLKWFVVCARVGVETKPDD
jgi:hypothetical protein